MQIRTIDQFNEFINLTRTLPTGIDKPTPYLLVDEMIALPDLDWKDPNLRILDPAFGFGTFLFACYLKLIPYHSEEHILNNMLYGVEIDSFRYRMTKHNLGIKNLFLADFLSWETDMKFHVIVGNPPYQDVRSKTAKLWFEFTKKAISLNPTYIAYVTPNGWFYEPSGLKIKSVVDSMLSGSIIYADVIGPNDYFSVGEDIGYWVWENSPNKIGRFKADWFGNPSEKEFVYTGTPAIVNETAEIRASIEEKLKVKNSISVRVEGIKGMTWKVGPDSVGLKEKLSEIPTEKYTIPVRLSPAKTMYTDSATRTLGVCVSNSGYYYVKGNEEKYMPVTDDPTGQNFLKLMCCNETEAKNIKSFLTSKLYRSYIEVMVNKAFNDYALARLPFLGRDVFWTDEMLYEYFELTPTEIEYVESSIS